MKKLLAIALSLLLVGCAFTAVAQEQTEGNTFQFEDHNLQFRLPNSWKEMELTQEGIDGGYFFASTNKDQTCSFAVKFTGLGFTTETAAVANEMIKAFGDADIIEINGIEFVSYVVADNDINGMATLNSEGNGLYCFEFYPASNEALAVQALQIAASIDTIQ